MASAPPVIIVAPTVVRYTFAHILRYGQKADIVMDISIDAVSVASRDTVVDDFNTHVNAFWQDTALKMFGTTSAFAGSSWLDLNSATGRSGTLGVAAGHPSAGSGAGGFLPPNVATLVHKRSTAVRGQRQGRSYFPDVPEATADDQGILPPAYVTSQTAIMESWRTAVGTYTYTGAVEHPTAIRTVHVHKPNPNDSTTWTWSSSTVDKLDVDTRVATQRRRLR